MLEACGGFAGCIISMVMKDRKTLLPLGRMNSSKKKNIMWSLHSGSSHKKEFLAKRLQGQLETSQEVGIGVIWAIWTVSLSMSCFHLITLTANSSDTMMSDDVWCFNTQNIQKFLSSFDINMQIVLHLRLDVPDACRWPFEVSFPHSWFMFQDRSQSSAPFSLQMWWQSTGSKSTTSCQTTFHIWRNPSQFDIEFNSSLYTKDRTKALLNPHLRTLHKVLWHTYIYSLHKVPFSSIISY